MKSADCDDNDHDSCSGKFYKHDDISKKKIKEPCSCSCHYKKKEDLNDGSSARHVHRILL
ncbi:MAG: hypothetical protein ACJ705_07365 [Nitrososphaeraceae archaeon]